MRKTMIVANWKMNMLLSDSLEYLDLLNSLIKRNDRIVIICPPYTLLFPLQKSIKKYKNVNDIKLGAQNIFYESSGAFTGEISPPMIKDTGCEYVLIGHSERRQYFNETNEIINKKIKSALSNNLKPIICVGENLSERKSNKSHEVVEEQLRVCLKEVNLRDNDEIIIAYEPVWAIGTGINATPQQAQEVHGFIKRLFSNIFPAKKDIAILYGGSVTPNNYKDLLNEKDINGLLVGMSSLSPHKFAEIINN